MFFPFIKKVLMFSKSFNGMWHIFRDIWKEVKLTDSDILFFRIATVSKDKTWKVWDIDGK